MPMPIARPAFAGPANLIEDLTASVEAEGLRVVSHINGQANAARLGIDAALDQIIEVFHPRYAVQVWQACKPAGLDIPLRIHIYDDGAGLMLAYRKPSDVFAPYQNPQLNDIGRQLDQIFARIMARVSKD